jgi:hypothetical protein
MNLSRGTERTGSDTIANCRSMIANAVQRHGGTDSTTSSASVSGPSAKDFAVLAPAPPSRRSGATRTHFMLRGTPS